MSSSQPDLERAWEDACAEFEKATDFKFASTPNGKSADDIVRKFEQAKVEAGDDEGQEKIDKAKNVVRRSVVVIEQLGIIVTQGASMVCGSPANIAMNCISYFIEVGFAYKEIAHNIEDLFSKIVRTLERFQIYRDNKDILKGPIIRVIHRLLLGIVNIITLCVKKMNHSKTAKVKRLLSLALFSSDGGIKAQFALLASLEEEERQVAATMTLVGTERNQRLMEAGLDSVKTSIEATNTSLINKFTQTNESNIEQKAIDDIKRNLGVDDTASKEEYRLSGDKLESWSCLWLQSDPVYQAWSDFAAESDPILVLSGEEGCGKSYTFTAMVRDLRKRYPQYRDNTSRTSVAFCYLARRGKMDPQSSKRTPSVKDVVREWALQCVRVDALYCKSIQALYKQSQDTGELRDILQNLFFDHLDDDVRFFLLLDGTHELDEGSTSDLVDLVQSLSLSTTQRSRFKIAITARPGLTQRLTSQSQGILSKIDLRERSQEDLGRYIREKAKNLSIFQRSSKKVQDLKTEVCKGLLDSINGNFILADVKLKAISTKDDFDEVRGIVGNLQGLESTMVEDIQKCNQTLNSREIEDLNVLLLWISYGKWPFSIAELEAVLLVQLKRDLLQPLAENIKGKFSLLLDMKEDEDQDPRYAMVSLKYDSIVDYFKNLSEDQEASNAIVSNALTEGEIRMAKHLVEKLCHQDTYTKLGFAEFFAQKLTRSDISVTVDCDNAHARLALTCLRVITMDSTAESNELRTYALFYTKAHLKETDLDRTDPRLKADLGPPLIKLFRDPEVIRKSNENLWMNWSYSDDDVQEVLRLLRSSALTSKINTSGDDNRQWVDAVLSASRPELALLEDSSKEMARLWFSSDKDEEIFDSFAWLYGYVNKIQTTNTTKEKRPTGFPSTNQIQVSDVHNIVEEIQARYPPESSLSNLDRMRNIAITHLKCEHISEAIQQFNALLETDSEYIHARIGLAQTYACEVIDGHKPEWKKALSNQNIVIDYLKSGKQVYPHRESKEHLMDLLLEKATWLRKLEQYEQAREIYVKLLQEEPENDVVRLQYLFTLCETQSYEVVVETLDELDDIDEKTKQNRLTRFLHKNVHADDYHSVISRAYKQVDGILRIQGYYQKAVSETTKDHAKTDFQMRYLSYALTYHLAAILWTYGDDGPQKEEAIKLWEQITEPVKTKGIESYTQILAARRLARIYIAQAVEAGSASPVAIEKLDKVRGFARAPKEATIDDDDAYGAGLSPVQARSMIGQYHRRVGETEKARELLRTDVDVGLKLLSDDDVENDYQGYRKLGDAFMDFGDDENAIAAWCLIQPTEGIQQYRRHLNSAATSDQANTVQNLNGTGSESEENTEPDLREQKRFLDGPLFYSCDGRCGKSWKYADDIYVCRECVDVQFDAPCLQKLQSGELTRDICDRNHTFLHVPAWTLETMERAEAGKVMVHGQVMDIKDWKESIRQEWGLSEPQAADVVPVADVGA